MLSHQPYYAVECQACLLCLYGVMPSNSIVPNMAANVVSNNSIMS